MNSSEIRSRFLKFFEKRGHAIIPSASILPENDPSSLFNTAGMQPLVPYLLGEPHPAGKRLVDSQKCIRTGDIDDVGDNRHLTFFEMLGNWSLGDYFKKEAINWSYEFLTSKTEGLGLDPTRLYVTVFKGTDGIPRDTEAINVWQEVLNNNKLSSGIAGEDTVINGDIRIIPLGVDDNFWIAGKTGPCGGDTEIFYDTRPEEGAINAPFETLVKNYRLIEIWNNVFMEFNKTSESKYEKLAKPNVDTGMGLERTTAAINGKSTVFETDLFVPILEQIYSISTKQDKRASYIVADHIKASVMMIADGVLPANRDQGYVLRRLLRRAVRYSDVLGMPVDSLSKIAAIVIRMYAEIFRNVRTSESNILKEIAGEEKKFRETLDRGIKEFEKTIQIYWNSKPTGKILPGDIAFNLYTTFGFPIELTVELAKEKGLSVNMAIFEQEMKKHQDTSRAGSEQKFKGGLGGTGEVETRYHTTTHLLHQALREVLGTHVQQKGSNITAERLRFDFVHPTKMTDEEKKKVEAIVNDKIQAALPVQKIILPKAEAEKTGALHFFGDKYGDQVSVYFIGNDISSAYSKEFCGGPHVTNTKELGHFKISKEEAVSAGVRRIKAILD